ncbi:15611_t:CDS:2 [Acaulospora colombiana]|uniref:15611_t:CDS:1 n=1 Tax=Acaulospora colombiana TaxID=27376 RepID=A0ACA9L463_9GLOM|nr:15611_t:CDS:2 [Acaulospora colombiana]
MAAQRSSEGTNDSNAVDNSTINLEKFQNQPHPNSRSQEFDNSPTSVNNGDNIKPVSNNNNQILTTDKVGLASQTINGADAEKVAPVEERVSNAKHTLNRTKSNNKSNPNNNSHSVKQSGNKDSKEKQKQGNGATSDSRVKIELDRKKSLPSQKQKKLLTSKPKGGGAMTVATTDEGSLSDTFDGSLNRRHSAPPKLNRQGSSIGKDRDQSKPSPLRTSVTPSPDPCNLPLLSPKILELRRSESFQQKPATVADEDTSTISADTANVGTKKTKNPTPATKQRRRDGVRSQARKNTAALAALPKGENIQELLARLEEQNSSLPPQDSTEFLLARLERQNEMLDNDPKSVCIQSNVLKANLETVQSLIDDITLPADRSTSPSDELIIPVLDEEDDDLSKSADLSNVIEWDFWTALIQDYTSVATKLPHLLAAKLQQGLPPKLRGLVWQSMCQASSTYLETMYSQLLLESSPYDKIIERDLARTFPTIEMFKEENGKGQTMLWNILKAYSLYDPLVGYCQGLGFLVGPLLMNCPENHECMLSQLHVYSNADGRNSSFLRVCQVGFINCFALTMCSLFQHGSNMVRTCHRLMETYDMRTMFTLKMEGLQQRLYQFTSLLSHICPNLYAHFQKHGVQSAMYASQWFLSLFAYTYPLPLVFRIYDVVFAEGAPETIMRVAIALLKNNEEKLLSFDEFEDLLEFLTSRLYESYNNEPTGLVKDAMALSSVITKAKLDQLSEEYVKDLEDQKKRAEEMVAVRFNGRFGRSKKDDSKRREKRDNKRWSLNVMRNSRHSVAIMQDMQSVISNSSSENVNASSSDQSSNSSDEASNPSEKVNKSSKLVASTSPPLSSSSNSAGMGVLHKQIEDLVTALSQLQKEHADVTEQLVNIKMEKVDLVTEVEELKSKLRGLEKENKRMSMSSTLSLDSATTLNDESNAPLSKLASLMAPGLLKIEEQLADSINLPRMTRRSSVPTYVSTPTDKMLSSLDASLKSELSGLTANDWAVELKKSLQREMLMAEELVAVRREKDELLQDNAEMTKRVEELETAVANSAKSQKALYDKNTFLQTEIERLDAEATQALYEQSTMENDVKEVKTLRFDNVKLNKENERLKKDIAGLEAKLSWSDNNADSNNTTPSASSRRVSFLNFFNNNGNNDQDATRSVAAVCSNDCPAAKRAENMEQMAKHVQSLLVESENARDAMSAQLEELNSLINGFANISDIAPFDPEGVTITPENSGPYPKPRPEKRLSSLSLASFFGS